MLNRKCPGVQMAMRDTMLKYFDHMSHIVPIICSSVLGIKATRL